MRSRVDRQVNRQGNGQAAAHNSFGQKACIWAACSRLPGLGIEVRKFGAILLAISLAGEGPEEREDPPGARVALPLLRQA